MFRLSVACISLVLLVSGARAEMPADARVVIERWQKSFNAGDIAAMAALYAPDATIWGTVSPQLTTGVDGVKAYFARAFKAGIKVEIESGGVSTPAGGDVLVEAGSYTFAMPKDGKTLHLPARYTFVLARQGDRWLIIHQHSSPLPKAPG